MAGGITGQATANGYPTGVQVWDVTLTVATGETTATATSDDVLVGRVIKVELDPVVMQANFTIKGYEANTALATGTRDHFLDYTVASAVELVIYPLFESSTDHAGAALTTKVSQPYIVCDKLTLDVASAVAANSIRAKVYVQA
jgi:hypothetical protein